MKALIVSFIWLALFFVLQSYFNWSELTAGIVTLIACVTEGVTSIEDKINKLKDKEDGNRKEIH